jgi:cell division protein FtsL
MFVTDKFVYSVVMLVLLSADVPYCRSIVYFTHNLRQSFARPDFES